jgi:hypothetical protein
MPQCVTNLIPVFCMPVACSVVTDADAFYGSLLISCSHFCFFFFVAIRIYVVCTWGNVFYTMSGNALRLMSKIGPVESCEKKVCLDVLHIELVIMYKLFMSLYVYDFS